MFEMLTSYLQIKNEAVYNSLVGGGGGVVRFKTGVQGEDDWSGNWLIGLWYGGGHWGGGGGRTGLICIQMCCGHDSYKIYV